MDHTDIAACFNIRFAGDHTEMSGGASEPLYEPAGDGRPARLYYREDYASSALHEAAHWCIAGVHRRAQVDFGYGYEPPPRSDAAQQRFFDAEVRTQALEQLFSDAAGIPFQPSADNLDARLAEFAARLEQALPSVQNWVDTSTDDRARRFIAALSEWRSGSAD